MRAWLIAIDLLQTQDVCIQLTDRSSQPIEINPAIGQRATVQDVERGQTHETLVPEM
jgi:hypothetical protein